MSSITIIGMGVIGTSLGLALRSTDTKNLRVIGSDVDRGNANKAQSMGAVDRTEGNLVGAVEGAQVVIIATPVRAIKQVMEIIGPYLEEGCLVTDTGSSKALVMEWAEQYLPRHSNFVGGNPIVSLEGSGPKVADGHIFDNRPYCLVPSTSAHKDSVRTMVDIVRSIGGNEIFLDSVEHDSLVAAVYHLPLILSTALVGCTSKSPSWDDIARIAHTRYGDMTQLVSGNPDVHADAIFTNEQGAVSWIDAFIRELYSIRQVLVDEDTVKSVELEKIFDQCLEARAMWLAGAVKPPSYEAMNRGKVVPKAGGMTNIFTGDPEARRRLFGWGGRKGRSSNDPE